MKRGTRESASSRRKGSTRNPSFGAVAGRYRDAIAGAIVHAVSVLTVDADDAIGVRRLVNFLRGNQLPPSGKARACEAESFGLLATHPARWVEEVIERLDPGLPGQLSDAQYDQTVADLVNFLDYVGEPVKQKRERLGFWVLAFLVIFFGLSYALKKEYWRDVH